MLALVVLAAAACGASPRGQALPEAQSSRRSESLSGERIRVWPGSTEAEVGVRYAYDTSPCGLTFDLDFDGSFWEPVDQSPQDEEPSFFINPDRGSITLISNTEARYESSDGQTVELRRLPGPVIQKGCG